MKLASAISTKADVYDAIEEACTAAGKVLGESQTDLALVFVTSPHAASPGAEEDFEGLPCEVQERTGTANILGCTAEGIIGGGREVEREPAVSVLLAHLPGVKIRPFTIQQADLEKMEDGSDFISTFGAAPSEEPTFLMIGDPFSINAMKIIAGLNGAYPGRPIVGGMASGGSAPGQHRIFCQGMAQRRGASGMTLTGDLETSTIVSQGCRPVGKHMVITRAKDNLIFEIGGRPAYAVLGEVLAALSEEELERANRGVHVGRVIDEARPSFGRGDFLVRNLMGLDPESGAIAVGDEVRPGQTIQFHLRDAEAAREDLVLMLADYRGKAGGKSAGGLLFSCNGRGERLFGVKDHDSALIRQEVGDLPVAGFFCAGEIGPIGGSNFLHGFTDSIAFFSPK